MPRTLLNSRRSRTSCSVIALATVLAVGATPAAAQSFLGTGTYVTNPHATGITTGVNTTTINLNGGQTVIDWVPTDNAINPGVNINFQNAGTTATFTASSDFSVLNRITPADMSRAIAMGGTVNARVGGVQRGNVYFYSPNGFVFGGTSVFSVGSLVVTTSPIQLTSGSFINGAENTVVFGQTPNPNAAIISNGTINANLVPFGVGAAGSSYVALVAPRVVHNGTITVNGSAALVGAEAATINFSPDGLFDIQVTVGTDDTNGVSITGDIGGIESAGSGDNHRIFLATVPKNDAVTMLVSSGANLGFDIAGAANVEGNAIVLSAGRNIVNGVVDTSTAVGSGAAANFDVRDSNFTSAFVGEATGVAGLHASTALNFASDVDVHSDTRVAFGTEANGATINADGDVTLSGTRFGTGEGQSVTGANVELYTVGSGTITIDGNLTMESNAFGGDSFTAGLAAGNGTGGLTLIQLGNSGSASIGGNIFMSANGLGGEPGVAGANAGNGTGGNAIIESLGNNTSLTVGGTTYASASGFGGDGDGSGNDCSTCDSLGGIGQGGLVRIAEFGGGGLLSFAGGVDLYAEGTGGRSASAGTASAAGNGGSVNVSSNLGAAIEFASDLYASASGFGGESFTDGIGSGSGQGGSVAIFAGANSSIEITGFLSADASGFGGFTGFGSDGGNGAGGDIVVRANDGGASLSVGQSASLTANGEAGSGGECISCGGTGGDGIGGEITVGGNTGTGNSLTFNNGLSMRVSGYGGVGVTGPGGNGSGGSTRLFASDGTTVSITGSLTLDADGFGGDSIGGNGGNGTGGLAEILTSGSTAQLDVLGNVLLEADGSGGSSFNEGPIGDGGDGLGGRVRAVADGGMIHVTGNLVMDAVSTGGSGENGGDAVGVTTPPGNEGQAPAAFLWAGAAGAELQVDGLTAIDVSATGGAGSFGGNGGNAWGGEIDIVSQQGHVNLGNLIGNADAFGGSGGFGGGAGGSATGGNIDVAWSLNPGAALTGTISAGTVNLSASGEGGDGGDGSFAEVGPGGIGGAGGSGTGGSVLLVGNAAGGTLNVGATTILANGLGGNGGNGGSGETGGTGGTGGTGTGGFIQTGSISVDGNPGSGGTASYTTLLASANATGGAGGSGGEGTSGLGAGGDGGDAFGGEANLLARGIVVTADSVSLSANAIGGDGGSGSAAGGDASAGFVSVESKDRFGHPTQRGSLTANSITGTAIAEGGAGGIAGNSTVRGGSFFRVLNGDATIGTLSLVFAGEQYDGTFGPNYIQAQDGTANIGTFSYDTTGDLAIYTTSTGTMNVGDLTLSAGNFIDHPSLAGPAVPGTIFATNLSVTSGGDFIADANLNVVNGIDITVPGSIRFDNAHSASFINLWAQGGSIDLDNVTADGDVNLTASGLIDIGSAISGESVELDAGGNVVALGLTAGDSVEINAGGSVNVGNLSAGLVNASTSEGADHNVKVVAGGNILTGDIEAAQHIGLATPGTMTTGDIAAGGIFMALGHGDMSFGDATASEVFLSDYGLLALSADRITATCVGACGTSGADGVVTAPPTGSFYSYVTTEGGVDGAGQLPGEGGTNGSVYTTSPFSVAAGDDLDFWFNYVTSDGSGFADYAWAALLTPSLDPVAILFTARTQPSGTIVPGFDLPGVEATLNPSSVPIIPGGPEWSPLGSSSGSCFSAGCGYTGWVNSTYEIANAGSYVLRFGVSNWTDTSFQSGMAFSGLSVGGVSLTPVLLTRTGGSISIGNVETGKFSAAAGTTLTTGIIDSSGSITLDAGGAIATGNLFAGNFVLANGGSITTGNIEASSVDMTSTGGNIATGDIFAFGSVELDAFGDILSGDITAGSIDLLAGDDISTGDLTTQLPILLAAQEGPVPSFLFPGASISLEAGGDIATGDIASIDGVYADAGSGISTGAIDAFDFVQLLAVDNITTGAINAGSFIDIFASNGGITTQALNASDGDIDLDANGNIAFASANAGGEFDFSTNGSVTGGNVVAGNEIGGDAGGNVTLGNLTAGLPQDSNFSVGIGAAGNIAVGNVAGAGNVGFATLGNLTSGNLSAGDLVMTLVGGNTTTGSITTAGEGGGQVYMADDSMFITGGGTIDGEGDFDESIVLALDPVATGGSITINGSVSTGLFRAAAGTTLTTQALSAGDASVFAGGLAVINGAWNVGDAKVISNDIDITATGSIAADGDITLVSKNATRTVVGDGTNLSGYILSNVEFGKLSANDITIIADTAEGAAPTMVIGNLNASATAFPAGVDYEFLTGNSDTETASGSIRVLGNVVFNGMTGENHSANFGTALFELDAATGSISLFSSGTTLGGELGLYANRIHVAEALILDQLAVNPTYNGYQQDLNEAATVQRPEGVIRADTLWIESDNLQSILIQNTGTGGPSGTPAGFLVRQAFVNDDLEVAGPPGSINLVVNGQVVTESGTVTGVAARDALVPEGTDITPFTSNSTINGCPLTGACIIAPPPPPPMANLVDSQIDLIGGDPFGEDNLEDTQEGDEGSSNPISPPQPLFDTRPLIPSGDVNDPVSGTGNPALLGAQCEVEEGGQCPADGDEQ